MKLRALPLAIWLPFAAARFDLTGYEDKPHNLQCPPQCSCARWTCIDEIDILNIQSKMEGKQSLLNDASVDEDFKCWKHCCKKAGVQVSTCEHNQCQKCCNQECTDIKSMIRTRRKFSSQECNSCLAKKCNHDKEYTSVLTTRSCRGLFNKYTTPFNASVKFQVEASRDLRIFLYDEPLNLIRQSLRKRRDAAGMEDVLDTEELDLLELGNNHLFEEINSRIRREIESMREKKKKERAQIRADIKALNKKKRKKKRARKTSQKHKYGKSPVNKTPEVPEMLHDFVFGSANTEEAENESEIDSAEQRRAEYEYEYESEYANEVEYEAEVVDDEASDAYDCRDHVDEMNKEDRKACNKKIKQMWRDEQTALRKASQTYRVLKPALENPLIVTQAIAKTEEQMEVLQHDAAFMDSAKDNTEADSALEQYLHMYGYNNPDASTSVFQSVFKSNTEQLFNESKRKQKKSVADNADWTRPHILRHVDLNTLGNLYVADKLRKEEKAKLERKQSRVDSSGWRSVRVLEQPSQIEVEASFSDKFDKIDRNSRVEEGFADEESGYHRDILNSGWIQIGLGSSNNTAADLKSCQNSSYKRCIGVLRKSYPNILQGDAPQEVTVSVTGEGTERILTVDIETKGGNDKKRIFEVLIDDPTIASLKHMAVCTTKGSRGKLGFKKCCDNDVTPNVNYMTTFRRMVDCQFSCLASNCRAECMPETKCEKCLVQNCGEYTGGNLN